MCWNVCWCIVQWRRCDLELRDWSLFIFGYEAGVVRYGCRVIFGYGSVCVVVRRTDGWTGRIIVNIIVNIVIKPIRVYCVVCVCA